MLFIWKNTHHYCCCCSFTILNKTISLQFTKDISFFTNFEKIQFCKKEETQFCKNTVLPRLTFSVQSQRSSRYDVTDLWRHRCMTSQVYDVTGVWEIIVFCQNKLSSFHLFGLDFEWSNINFMDFYKIEEISGGGGG